MNSFHKNNQGFTLIEIMAVLVIMGVIISVGMHKINYISGTAELRALETGIAELNVRETLYWTNVKFQAGGWNNDDDVKNYPEYNTNLGSEYSLLVTPAGGTLSFRTRSENLIRTPSTNTKSARWAP